MTDHDRPGVPASDAVGEAAAAEWAELLVAQARAALAGHKARQAGAVAADALHADTLDVAQTAQPSPQLPTARTRRRERRRPQHPARRVERRGSVPVAVRVHPAHDSILIWHNQQALLGTSNAQPTTGRNDQQCTQGARTDAPTRSHSNRSAGPDYS